ncbi:hypothetical protein HPB50_023691 [Hyalomma asiaticum]|uniref:Uncharacterized protein n=1 Tax=Hyalomma asiaticum TaxID=266040 RepID=A0ACB7TQC5_HYAAI|nr:hypothetical protein HPB50_023691 [Hyalomma asiaticum]
MDTEAQTDAPVCKQDSAVVYVGSRGDEVQVVCEVLAHPDLVSFQWSFDGGGEGGSRAIHSGFSGDRATLSSVMRYTPLTEADFGTLYCRANNSAGHQRRPCVFHIVQARHAAIIRIEPSFFPRNKLPREPVCGSPTPSATAVRARGACVYTGRLCNAPGSRAQSTRVRRQHRSEAGVSEIVNLRGPSRIFGRRGHTPPSAGKWHSLTSANP